MVSKSRLSRLQQKDQLVLVDRTQVHAQRLLGSGAFSQVHLVTVGPETASTSRTFAMKHIKPELLRAYTMHDYGQDNNDNDDDTTNNSFCLAACELAVEAHLLASFDHPNIIAIRGWASNGVASFAQGCRHDSFFLLLDPLHESLDQRLLQWKQERQQAMQGGSFVSPDSSPVRLKPQQQQADPGFWSRWATASTTDHTIVPQQQPQEAPEHGCCLDDPDLYAEKIRICTEIASALAYLHESRSVIYRDLKPNNIGFLSNGRVQLFDFGLSRELPSAGNLTDPFCMSGKVGTLRYMSCEVATHQPYTVSADVYSYAMVSYEILTLCKPFQGWTRDMHSKLVCARHMRPDLTPLAMTTTAASRPLTSRLVRPLIEASWSPLPHQRPSMGMVHEQMNMILQDCERSVLCREESASQQQQQHSMPEPMPPQQQRSVSIELPPDFDVRKAPSRSVSASTKTTVSMSASTSCTGGMDHGNNFFFFG